MLLFIIILQKSFKFIVFIEILLVVVEVVGLLLDIWFLSFVIDSIHTLTYRHDRKINKQAVLIRPGGGQFYQKE